MEVGVDAAGRDAAVGLCDQDEAIAEIVDVQRERVVGAFVAGENLDATGKMQPGALTFRRAVPVVEHGAEQWRSAASGRQSAATLRQCERRLLELEQFDQLPVGMLDDLPDALPAQVEPQRQGVDEHAEDLVGPGGVLQPPGKHAAKDDVIAPAAAREQQPERGMKQRRRTDAQLPRRLTQASGQLRVDFLARFLDLSAVAMHVEQAERRRRLVDVAKPAAEENLRGAVMTLFFERQRLRDETAIGNRLGQLRGMAGERGEHLAQDDFERNVIADDVVQLKQQVMLAAPRIACRLDAHQRRPGQVHALALRLHERVQLRQGVLRRVESNLFDRQVDMAMNDLHRFGKPLPEDGAAQDVVPIDDALQSAEEDVALLAALHRHQDRQDVGVAFLAQQMVEQDAFLQRGERIDVLHVGGATRHRRDDPVDLRLAEFDQGQQRRRDRRAASGNQVGGNGELRCALALTAAQCLRQRRRRRMIEDGAHIAVQTRLTQTFEHLHDQQRVSAKVEEIIVAADAFDVENVLPDPRDGLFELALRRHVFARQGALLRRRQGLVVQLAVGRQRKLPEHDIGARQHVFGQDGLELALHAIEIERL